MRLVPVTFGIMLALAAPAPVKAAGRPEPPCSAASRPASAEVSRKLSRAELPEAVRERLDGLVAGGRVERIDREGAGDNAVFDVEATVEGKHVEWDIAADGAVLSIEQEVPYASLPGAVRAAVEAYYGSDAGLRASREEEKGETFYEVEGKKAGKPVALKLDAAGGVLEEESE